MDQRGRGPQLTFFTASRAASAAVSIALRTLVDAALTWERATFDWPIARFVYEHVYPSLPREYRTSDCYDGGPYDLRPASPVFP